MLATSSSQRRHSFVDLSGFAPAGDIPTITVSAIGQSGTSTVSGTAGWYREKRVGVAEVGPVSAGNAQTSSNTGDLTGSTHFGYWGSGVLDGWTSNVPQYIFTQFRPGGSTQNSRQLFCLHTNFTGTEMEIRLNVSSTSGRIGLILVNGKRIQNSSPAFPATPAAGSGGGVKLTWGSSATRLVQIYGLSHMEGRFGGVAANSGGTTARPPTPGGPGKEIIAFVGDSYTQGDSATDVNQTWMWQAGLRLGGSVLVNMGIGGTGIQNTINSDATSVFSGRRAVTMAENPDRVFISGGRNDGGFTQASNQSAVEAEIDYYLGQGIARNKICIVPTATTGSSAYLAYQAAAGTRNVMFPPLDVNSYAKQADGIHMSGPSTHTTFGNDVADYVIKNS
jgi:hypothetical protein